MNEHRLDKVAEEGEGCRREEGRFWPVKGVCVCVCGGGGGGGGVGGGHQADSKNFAR